MKYTVHTRSNYARFVHKLRRNPVEDTIIYFYLLIAAVANHFSKQVIFNFLHQK